MSIWAVLIVVFIFSFTGCKTTAAETTAAAEKAEAETTTLSVQENGEHNIGDTGPAGGFIFYINPNYATDGWKYLEAAPSDLPSTDSDGGIQWYNRTRVEIGATGTAIGTGMSNTQKIVGIQGNGSYAAKLCSDLTQGGYGDWFMPSKDELNLMYGNLYLKGIGSFEPDYYWSSSEDVAFNVWYQGFANDRQDSYENHEGYIYLRVRAVRAFN
jgi:hypothetical protein